MIVNVCTTMKSVLLQFSTMIWTLNRKTKWNFFSSFCFQFYHNYLNRHSFCFFNTSATENVFFLACASQFPYKLLFWVERGREIGMINSEQMQLGMIFEERVIEPLVLKLGGEVSFMCGLWGGLLKMSLMTM